MIAARRPEADGAGHSGSCRCGAIRFAAAAAPHFSGYCHCEDCRRAAGAPVVAFVGFDRADVTWRGTEPARYGAKPVERLFCRDCGSPLGYSDERLVDHIYVYTCALDRPQDHPPQSHSYCDERMPWLQLLDDLPEHETTAVRRPDEAT